MPHYERAVGRRVAVLDWSGVLVDEIEVLAELHGRTIAWAGGRHVSPQEWKATVSERWTEVYVAAGVMKSRLHEAGEHFCQLYLEEIDRVRPSAGAEELLRFLSAEGTSVVILSNQFADCIEAFMARHAWQPYIERVVAASSTDAPKGDPSALWDILRTADCAPYDAFLVDDMTGGIQLARTVGLATIGVRSSLTRDLSLADAVVDDLGGLQAWLASGHIDRGLRTATPEYRAHYEERERRKLHGDIARLPDWYHAENDALVRFVRRATGVSAGSTVVDVGCGSSHHAEAAVRRLRAGRVVRLDLTMSALVRSRPDPHLPVFSVQGDAATLPLRSRISDLTLCLETLEHVIDPAPILDELVRVTRPGAPIVIAVPNSMAQTNPLFRGLQSKSHDAGHVREYDVDKLAALLRERGLTVASIGTRWHLAYWLAFSIERSRLCRPVSRLLARSPLLREISAALIRHAIFWETRTIGRRSRHGIGLLTVVSY